MLQRRMGRSASQCKLVSSATEERQYSQVSRGIQERATQATGNEAAAGTVAVDLCSSDRSRWHRAELEKLTGRCRERWDLRLGFMDPHIMTKFGGS